MLSIGKFAKSLGVSIQTLRNWDKEGKLKPTYVTENGYRYYSCRPKQSLQEYHIPYLLRPYSKLRILHLAEVLSLFPHPSDDLVCVCGH